MRGYFYDILPNVVTEYYIIMIPKSQRK